MTVFDLEEAELAYSPQFGSAKDLINMVAFVAAALLRGEHPQIDVEHVLPAPDGDLTRRRALNRISEEWRSRAQT